MNASLRHVVGSSSRLDALRGVAAFSVLIFHLFNNSPQSGIVQGALSETVLWLPNHARSGVACFFVISGFVIADPTRNLGTSARAAGRFAVRRQLRLDPPYYVMIAVVLSIGAVQRLVPGLEAPSYSLADDLLNMAYLQDITDTPNILAVSWTLCLEVQFYVVVITLILLSGRLAHGPSVGHTSAVRTGALTLMAASLAIPFLGWELAGRFLPLWWMFCTGMLLDGTASAVSPAPSPGPSWECSVPGASGVPPTGDADPWGGEWTAWGTGVLILVVIEFGDATARVPGIFLYAGALSDSLYLVHLPVIETVLGAFSSWPARARA